MLDKIVKGQNAMFEHVVKLPDDNRVHRI